LTGSAGFDDIVMLDPHTAAAVDAAARLIARRGTLNLVGKTPLDGPVPCDVGRLHYDYIALVGNPGPDISASYGEARNRCDLRADGVCVIIGAGGPMGQMHLQRALEHPQGPRMVIASDINIERLRALRARFLPLAEARARSLLIVDATDKAGPQLDQLVREHSGGRGADDVVVCVPSPALMGEAGALLNDSGMLVLFAGVPNGTRAPLDVSAVYLGNAQFTGTSGLTLHDQALVMQRAGEGALSPERSVAAIGGMNAAREGISALMAGRFPGKIVIWPQVPDLPLTALDDLHTVLPAVAAQLGDGAVWTREAEDVLIAQGWTPPA
jgi:L-sorbose 1-phosphate reductase